MDIGNGQCLDFVSGISYILRAPAQSHAQKRKLENSVTMHRFGFRLVIHSLALAAPVLAQTTILVPNTTVPTTGADIGTFQRGVRHFTFDLQVSTGGSDWTGSEVSVDTFGASIWHASDQRIAERDTTPADPNDALCYAHNLNTPDLQNTAANRLNTRMYDTFFTRPGVSFTTDPLFASPGLPPSESNPCPDMLHSDSTRIRGLNGAGTEIPLAWFDASNIPLSNAVLARITLDVPNLSPPFAGVHIRGEFPLGILLATITGRTTSASNPSGTPFRFEIETYRGPEPSTLASFAALATLIRRRRA